MIEKLSEDYLRARTEVLPFWASFLGVPGSEGLLPDASAAGEAASAARLRDLAGRAEAVDPEALSPADRVSRAVLVHEARGTAEQLEDGHVEFMVNGPFAPVPHLFLALSTASPAAAADVVTRLEGLPGYFAQLGERVVAGAAKGRGPHAGGVRAAVEQLASYLKVPLERDPLLRATIGTPSVDRAVAAVRDQVRPAAAALLEVLRGPVSASARDDDHVGLVHTPGGEGAYRRALAFHTTTARTPEEIHQVGLELCRQLEEEYATLGLRLFGTSDVAAVLDRLRNDRGLRYTNSHEMLADAREALARADAAVPDWFGTSHRMRCEVEEMDALEAPSGVLGRYLPPSSDGTQPGYHLLNTHRPEIRTRYEYEALAFHESVPGHHLQFTVGQELGDAVPAFRRFGYLAAFSEGWGLYTERLCEEMGLYSSDLSRFGMVSFDSWRATRLVVDTGMHHYGWSRQRAIEFMWENSALTRENIEHEVDRYIAWPGQACAYMIGRLEILEARTAARQRLGAAFDIKDFHDALLLNGSVPLSVLREELTRRDGAQPLSASASRQ